LYRNVNKAKLMEIKELSALRAGLKLFANVINEVARRSDVSPTYVKVTLGGNVKNWQSNPTCLRIIEEAEKLYAERHAASERYKSQLAG
jgi:hypothetical protein